MTNKNLTHIDFILDRSGSMDSCRTDTEGGFNAYIKEQSKVEGECRVSLHQFDDRYETVYKNKPINKVPPLILDPRGSTALLDAIGKTIVEKGRQLADLPEHKRPGTVIIGILTDGQENSSQEYEFPAIEKMIKHQTDHYSWLFVFLGANQDAIATGSRMGIARHSTMTYDTHNTSQAFNSLSGLTTRYRGSMASSDSYAVASAAAAFTDEDREEAVSPK